MARVTQAVLDLFRERGVYHRFGGGERWRIGDNLRVAQDTELEPYCHVMVGDALPARMGSFSYAMSQLAPHVRIGRYCSIASNVEFVESEHPVGWASTSPFSYSPYGLDGFRDYLTRAGATSFPLHPPGQFHSRPVEIGHDVWIGQGAMIAGGVRIGHGAIIAARAVVTRDVAPYAIVGGAPARLIRMRFPDALAGRLAALAWWRFGPDVLQPLDVRDPETFATRLEDIVSTLTPHQPAPLTSAEIAAAAG